MFNFLKKNLLYEPEEVNLNRRYFLLGSLAFGAHVIIKPYLPQLIVKDYSSDAVAIQLEKILPKIPLLFENPYDGLPYYYYPEGTTGTWLGISRIPIQIEKGE